jgi:cyclic dehypoxanthinyl futalosine synthase
VNATGAGAGGGGPTGSRLSDAQALDLLECGDLLSVGAWADEVRRRLHPGGEVTFVIDRNINYTNVCVSGCRFCAFFVKPGDPGAYLLTREEIDGKVAETIDLGGTAIMMQGGLHPELDIAWFERTFGHLRTRFPSVHLHCLSPPEIAHVARRSGLTVEQTLLRLQEAGLASLPGGGAEVLSERARRRVSPHKISAGEWIEVMRTAHRIGMPGTATMMFGALDAPAEQIEHLRRIRDLQDETRGFTAFIPWTFQSGHTDLEDGHVPATGWDYLRLLAVSRIYLDNVAHVQASWVTQGIKLGQVALAFGADDLGSTMIEENVVRAAGVDHRVSLRDMVAVIGSAGFTPVQRDTLYREVRRRW